VLLAFWAFRADFGAVRGDFQHPQHVGWRMIVADQSYSAHRFFAAMELFTCGDFDPATTTGVTGGMAWCECAVTS
jgi:hypothetical protein